MILEGLVTTLDADGAPHLAPMGPTIVGDFERLILRPFPSSHTCQNLLRSRQGVLHVTDDVLLLAQAAVGQAVLPSHRPAEIVEGILLSDACRAHEFQVESVDAGGERVHIGAVVQRVHHHRDFWGFNRGKHAVVEAAILATRLHLLPAGEVESEFRRLKTWIDKTGGEAEREAFRFLDEYRRGRQ